MDYYGLKMDVVQFATELQVRSGSASLSTTITRQGKSAVYCVSIATDTLSVDTVEELATIYCLQLTNIWSENTPDTSLPRK